MDGNFGGSTVLVDRRVLYHYSPSSHQKNRGDCDCQKILKRTPKCYQHPDLWGMASIFFSHSQEVPQF